MPVSRPGSILTPRCDDDSEKLIPRAQFVRRYLANNDLPQAYWNAPKREKKRILDAASAATGYHRKSLIRLLKRLRRRARKILKRSGRPCTPMPRGRPS